MSCKFRPLEPAEAETPQQSKYMTTVRMGPRGQIVLPKDARELFGLNRGDTLVVLGDTNPGTAGIALVPAQLLTGLLDLANQRQQDAENAGEKEDEP